MATEVKGLKVGDKVIAVTFDSANLPDAGAFKGFIIDHVVSEIIDDTTIVLQMVKKPEHKIKFDFKEDTVNCFYVSGEKNNFYTGIFTNMKIFFDQYKDIYIKVKGADAWPKPEEPPKEEQKDESQK